MQDLSIKSDAAVCHSVREPAVKEEVEWQMLTPWTQMREVHILRAAAA